MPSPVLIFPGLGNSGPTHWQSRWEESGAGDERIALADWNRPSREAWVSALERAVARMGAATIVVAHSLACLTVAHWASNPHSPIRAALLVAPPDPDGAAFPVEATGFSPLPDAHLDFRSIVVASANDPYASLQFARGRASAWGSRLVEIGAAGHINAESGHGDWAEGRLLLQALDT